MISDGSIIIKLSNKNKLHFAALPLGRKSVKVKDAKEVVIRLSWWKTGIQAEWLVFGFRQDGVWNPGACPGADQGFARKTIVVTSNELPGS